MNLKAIACWLALAFVVWWVIVQPTAATHIVSDIGHWLTSAVHGISHFFATI